jgi:hypothetical protein
MEAPMATNLEFLESTFESMLDAGLVRSKAEFSAEYLDKGPSYLTSMSARGRQVPNQVIGQLALNLEVQRDVAAAEIAAIAEQHGVLSRRHAALAGLLADAHGHRVENLCPDPTPEPDYMISDDDLLGRYLARIHLEQN